MQQEANFNVTVLINSSGSVVERFVYDPYGQTTFLNSSWTVLAGSAYAWVVLHQGGRSELATGFNDFRNRVESHSLGRWAQLDPMGLAAGDTNLYRYILNNPINGTDPTGEFPWLWCGIGAAIGLGQALLGDLFGGNLDACRTTVAALISSLLGCASAAVLANPQRATFWLVDMLRSLGFSRAAEAVWRAANARNIVGIGEGIGLGWLAALSSVAAEAICESLRAACRRPSVGAIQQQMFENAYMEMYMRMYGIR